jgi:hypothetical protein
MFIIRVLLFLLRSFFTDKSLSIVAYHLIITQLIYFLIFTDDMILYIFTATKKRYV